MTTPKLEITYNPYTVKSQIIFNGKIRDDFQTVIQNKRLQQWIDQLIEVVYQQSNECNNLKITFIGTQLDSLDVKSSIDSFEKLYPQCKIIYNDKQCKNIKPDQKLKEVISLFNEAIEGPFNVFKTDENKYAFEKAISPNFEVTVLATMSAGKSTLINAMLGRELMPSKNEACTATLSKIYDKDGMQTFEARQVTLDGKEGSWQDATVELLDNWNSQEDTVVIEVQGDILEINQREGIRLVLVDTPGPNNSRDDSHQKATLEAITSNHPSMVLYLLNATQLSTNDDKALLNIIKDQMSKGGREAQDRFIFIANKIDNFDPEKGESIAGALNNVRQYLIDNGINNPTVIPVSASLTKMLRMQKNEGEKLSRLQRGTLNGLIDLFIEEPEMNLLEHSKSQISSQMYQTLNVSLQAAKLSEDDEKAAEILSGVPIIEALLDEYISKHALPSRIKDAIDVFQIIDRENNIAQSLNNMLNDSNEKREQILQKISAIENDKARIQTATKFREKVKLMKYQASIETKETRTEIDRKFNNILDELSEIFKEDVSPSDAKRLLKNGERKAKLLIAEIDILLETDLEKEQLSVLNQLRDDYQNYIANVLEQAFPEKDMADIKKLQSVALQMPSAKKMIDDAIYEDKHEEFVRTERHGFLWLKKRNVYRTVYEDKVNMAEIGDEFITQLQKTKMSNFVNADEALRNNFEKAKVILIKQMAELDDKLKTSLDELATSFNDKTKLEKNIKDNEGKQAWYKEFKFKLDAILNV